MGTHNRKILAGGVFLFLPLLSVSPSGGRAAAQEDSSRIHVDVVLVQLSVAVTDRKGNYVTGLKPENFEMKPTVTNSKPCVR